MVKKFLTYYCTLGTVESYSSSERPVSVTGLKVNICQSVRAARGFISRKSFGLTEKSRESLMLEKGLKHNKNRGILNH